MRYGDYDNVTKDSKALFDILQRQGSGLLLEVIAEQVGKTALATKLNAADIRRLKVSLVNELCDAIDERT